MPREKCPKCKGDGVFIGMFIHSPLPSYKFVTEGQLAEMLAACWRGEEFEPMEMYASYECSRCRHSWEVKIGEVSKC